MASSEKWRPAMAEKMSLDAVRQALAEGLAGWRLDEGREAIRRQFVFTNFREAWGFMTEVALLAEKANHHPEWRNVYGEVEIVLMTHSVGGVSEADLEMARKIDKVVGRYCCARKDEGGMGDSPNIDSVIAELLAKERQAWVSPDEIPAKPGFCAIFLKPDVSLGFKNMRDDGLVYIGTSNNIRRRLQQHFHDLAADRSTLRWSLGALLKTQNKLQLQPVTRHRGDQKHYGFETASEICLSEWMKMSLVYTYVKVDANLDRNKIKSEAINSLRPPLNIESNESVHSMVTNARKKCANEAKGKK